MHGPTRFRRRYSLFVAAGLLTAGCGLSRPVQPAIEFSTCPRRPRGARTGSRRSPAASPALALASRSCCSRRAVGVWWVQPFTAQPFTTIEPDSTWKNSDPSRHRVRGAAGRAGISVRPLRRDACRSRAARSSPSPPSRERGEFVPGACARLLTFSGYEWEVRQTPSDRGGANDYDPDNAWTDADGVLHLRLTQRDGRWTSAEVILNALARLRHVRVRRPRHVASRSCRRVQPVHVGRSGRRTRTTASWTSRSATGATAASRTRSSSCSRTTSPANVTRFAAPAGPADPLVSLGARAARRSSTVRGTTSRGGDALSRSTSSRRACRPRQRAVRMNLYYFRYSPSPPQKDVEVVIERFQYLP